MMEIQGIHDAKTPCFTAIWLLHAVFLVQSIFFSPDLLAEATAYTEQAKLIRAPQAVTTLGANLFGDRVNLYTGALEFVQTDVTIPGNSSLPVSVG